MIPGDLLSAFPHRQFHTLPGLLDSRAALPNSNPNACVPMQGGSLHHFYDGLWYDPAERRTHDLPCERRIRYRLSQPDTVPPLFLWPCFTMLTHSHAEGQSCLHIRGLPTQSTTAQDIIWGTVGTTMPLPGVRDRKRRKRLRQK